MAPTQSTMRAAKRIINIANSTLRIKLTDNSDEDLLVDRALVISLCPTLEPVLRHPGEPGYQAAWDRSVMTKIDGQEDEVRVTTLALNAVDGTCLLSGGELRSPPEDAFYSQFRMYDLAGSEWKLVRGDGCTRIRARWTAVNQHKLLFKILHGVKHSITPPDHPRFSLAQSSEIDDLISVCALAEYYGCLRPVIEGVIKRLILYTRMWEDVPVAPITYLRFAVKLEWKELYFDAVRHIMANPSSDEGEGSYLQELADHWDISEEHLQAHIATLLKAQADIIADLDKELEKLKLCKSYIEHGGQKHPARITYANQLHHELESRPPRVRRSQLSRFLACSIYSQWMTEQKVGEHVFMKTKVNGRSRRTAKPSGPFNFALWRLEQAASWSKPEAVFGTDATHLIMTTFGYGNDKSAIDEVRAELAEIVAASNKHIKLAFLEHDEDLDDGTKITYRRARCDKAQVEYTREGYLTYLPVDETDLPWTNEERKNTFWEAALGDCNAPGEAQRPVWEKEQEERDQRGVGDEWVVREKKHEDLAANWAERSKEFR